MSPTDLLKSILEDEHLLRSSISSATPSNARDITAIRQRMIEKAEALVILDVGFAAQHEVEQVLWKPCFYKRIEEFRKRIRKYANASSSDPRVQEHFVKICADFEHFVMESSKFYERLNVYFRKCFDSDAYPIQARTKSRQSCQRCLVILGDFARYRELHNQKKRKDYSKAEGYYHKALAVMPQRGSPHNQLAVLATYSDAECVAVYRYCRSLMVEQPFSTSHENLALLFEKNRQQSASESPLRSDGMAAVHSTGARPKDKTARLKTFLQRVIRSHGILYANNTKAETKSVSKLNYSLSAQRILCEEFSELLRASAIGYPMVLKLLVINMFSIVHLADRQSGTPDAENERAHGHAVSLMMEFLACILEYLGSMDRQTLNRILLQDSVAMMMMATTTTTTTTTTGSSGSSGSSAALPSDFRLLSSVSLSCDFLQAYPIFMTSNRFATSRERFLRALAVLLNQLVIPEQSAALLALSGQLRESVELRGCLPLEVASDIYASDQRLPDRKLDDNVEVAVRVVKMDHFAKYVCSQTMTLQHTGNKYVVHACSSSSRLLGAGDGGAEEDEDEDGADDDDDDDDDEVIVFNPSAEPSMQISEGSGALGGHANAVLLGNVHIGSTTPEALGIKPAPVESRSYASIVASTESEYRMFGPSPVALEYAFEDNQTPQQRTSVWSTPNSKPLIPSFLQSSSERSMQSDPTTALHFLEMQTEQYEMGSSSLSSFLRRPSSTPPGFESSSERTDNTNSAAAAMRTSNPFIMSDT